MSNSIHTRIRELLPAWLACVLAPLLAILFWRSDYGQTVALWIFFACCASLVAYAFRPEWVATQPAESWNERMIELLVALFSAFVVVSASFLLFCNPHDYVTPFIALQILVPSLCVVPYVGLTTRKPFAAVVLSLFLVGCMKMLAGAIVCLVYGWHEYHHDLPWKHPNLMLSMFWVNTGTLSATFYFLGAKKFQRNSGLQMSAGN